MAAPDVSAMQGVVATPNAPELAQPAPVVAAADTTGVVAAPGTTPSGQDEQACETLYIQNLNEKIKIDGTHYPDLSWVIAEVVLQ